MAEIPRVDVLIVSLCAAERAGSIRRTVAAVLDQQEVDARVVMVVNGRRFDPSLFDELCATPRVEVLYQETPSIFLARRRARDHVSAPFFGFIDDDDLYLPRALAVRTRTLLTDSTVDVVVTNGWLAGRERDVPMLDDLPAIRSDPLLAMLRANWLATASAQFRTASIHPEYFEPTLASNDMTYLGFRLALDRRIEFVDVPTYRKVYSSDSISLTDAWALRSLDTLRRLNRLSMPLHVRRELRHKMRRASHEISNIYLRHNERARAWHYHLRSLTSVRTLTCYGLYTRHLLQRLNETPASRITSSLNNSPNRSFEGPRTGGYP